MNKKLVIILSIVLVLALAVGGAYLIDMNRIKNNENVIFGTWGYDYAPPVEEAETKEILEIIDRTLTEDIPTDEALEKFYEDEENEYYFGSIKSEYVIVKYKDGSEENAKEAMESGRVGISDLNNFNIEYITEPKQKIDLEARNNAYVEVLNKVYFEHVLADGTELYFDEEDQNFDITQNRFAISDVDSDGKEELIIDYITAPMAGMITVVYDFDEKTNAVIQEFIEFPTLSFYENGIVEAKHSHNQGMAGEDFWPYSLYKYDIVSDSYTLVGIVDAWSKSFTEEDNEGNAFPEDIDKDKDGIVYYIMTNGVYELNTPVDSDEYNEWRNLYVTDMTEVNMQYMTLTEENINSLIG